MDEADQVSNWIDIIDHGKIIASGNPLKLKDELGRDMIYLETSDDEAALQMVRSLEVVKDVRRDSKGLRITITTDGTRCLPVIMEMLKDQGLSIAGVNLKKPTLDDVFVYHTGRNIRNAAGEKLSARAFARRH
jgi:ABC-2 type transport system ATP-binding protein